MWILRVTVNSRLAVHVFKGVNREFTYDSRAEAERELTNALWYDWIEYGSVCFEPY